MVYRAKPADPHQLAMYGHIAAILRAAMAERKWSPADFNEAMGVKRDNTAIYSWLNCKAAPGPTVADRIAKVIGCKAIELRPKPYATPKEVAEGAVTVLPPFPGAQVGRPPKAYAPADVMSFAITAEGETRIKLDVVLPIERGAPLFRLLMDAGLVMGTSSKED